MIISVELPIYRADHVNKRNVNGVVSLQNFYIISLSTRKRFLKCKGWDLFWLKIVYIYFQINKLKYQAGVRILFNIINYELSMNLSWAMNLKLKLITNY